MAKLEVEIFHAPSRLAGWLANGIEWPASLPFHAFACFSVASERTNHELAHFGASTSRVSKELESYVRVKREKNQKKKKRKPNLCLLQLPLVCLVAS